jgi:hypothetical protein
VKVSSTNTLAYHSNYGKNVLCAWSLLLCFQSVETKKKGKKIVSLVFLITEKNNLFYLFLPNDWAHDRPRPGNPNRRGRINTVDLLGVFSSDQLLYILIIHFSFF